MLVKWPSAVKANVRLEEKKYQIRLQYQSLARESTNNITLTKKR